MKSKTRTLLSLLAVIVLLGALSVMTGCSSPAYLPVAGNGNTDPEGTPPDSRIVYPWVTSTKGIGVPPVLSSNPYECQGESFTAFYHIGSTCYNYQGTVVALILGGHYMGSGAGANGNGEWAEYKITFAKSMVNAKLDVRYSDQYPGNVIYVYLDGAFKGSFTTTGTGSYVNFKWHFAELNPGLSKISLGNITGGNTVHYVRFYVQVGGSYGFNFDKLRISADSIY